MRSSAQWMLIVGFGVFVWCVSANLNQAQPVSGAKPGGTKVAVVDLVGVFNEFEQTKVLNQKIQEYETKTKQEFENRKTELSAEQKVLADFTAGTPPWKDQRDKYRKMVFDAKAWEMTEKAMMEENHFEWLISTYNKVTRKVEEIAQREGYELVVTQEDFDPSAREIPALLQQILNRKVVYSHNSIDLTQRVLIELNDDFQKAGGAKSINFAR